MIDYSRFAVACPGCKSIIHVASPGYMGVFFMCPKCGLDWEEKQEGEEEEE